MRPNPWIVIPSLLAGALAALAGWVVTEVSCRIDSSSAGCPGWAAGIATIAFVAGTIGMLIVSVLVSRSLAEHRAARARSEETPGPGCEV